MSSFSDGFWNIWIFVLVIGSFYGLYLLLRFVGGPASAEGGEAESMGHVWDEDLYELNNPLPRWWLILFWITILWGFVYLLLYPGFGNNDMLLGWTQEKQYEQEVARAEERYGPLFEQFLDQPVQRVARNEQAVEMGERLFVTHCATCHGSDARGVRGFPNLRDDDWLWGGDPQAIKTSILQGRTGQMPAWQAQLGEQGVENVTQYVLSLSGRDVDEQAAALGKEQYQQLCVACHGEDGKGNQHLGAPDLTDGTWLYGGSERAVRASIAAGRQGRMPAHEDFLGEAKVHLLAAYVYSLSN